jgi:hypothetical protein
MNNELKEFGRKRSWYYGSTNPISALRNGKNP